jgi:hypothetical protein
MADDGLNGGAASHLSFDLLSRRSRGRIEIQPLDSTKRRGSQLQIQGNPKPEFARKSVSRPQIPANPIAAIPAISIASQSLRDISRTTTHLPRPTNQLNRTDNWACPPFTRDLAVPKLSPPLRLSEPLTAVLRVCFSALTTQQLHRTAINDIAHGSPQ